MQNTSKEFEAQVDRVEWIAQDCYRFWVIPEIFIKSIEPGQFFMLRRQHSSWPLLPRPFSIYRVDGNKLGFLIKVMGTGTHSLSQAKSGEKILCVGPLGTPFPEVKKKTGFAILAGGIGIAPFAHVLDCALKNGVEAKDVDLFFGARNKDMFYDLPYYQKAGVEIRLSSDDGSAGFRGNAVDCLRQEVDAGQFNRNRPIFVCGPEKMLEAAGHLSQEKKLKMFISLETFMACGIGICNGCAVPVEPAAFAGWPYAKACREGPTFDASVLKLKG